MPKSNYKINRTPKKYLHSTWRSFFSKENSGYTLLETVVALGIILSALAGPVSLIIRGLYDSSFSKNKLVALNLAQEGIELVRLIRENNAICIEKGATGWTPNDWDRDYDGTDGNKLKGNQRTINVSGILATVHCNVGGTDLIMQNPTMTADNTCLALPLKIDGDGNYGYGGQNTVFTRCITIQPPGADESGPNGRTIDKQDMLDITATVTWQERETFRTVNLTERLYNWH